MCAYQENDEQHDVLARGEQPGVLQHQVAHPARVIPAVPAQHHVGGARVVVRQPRARGLHSFTFQLNLSRV